MCIVIVFNIIFKILLILLGIVIILLVIPFEYEINGEKNEKAIIEHNF